MFDIYSLHSIRQDRDLSRAASERYLLLQALAERRSEVRANRVHRLLTRLSRPIRSAPTRGDAATAEVP